MNPVSVLKVTEGERDVVTVGDGTGEVSLGRRPTSVVTTGISW